MCCAVVRRTTALRTSSAPPIVAGGYPTTTTITGVFAAPRPRPERSGLARIDHDGRAKREGVGGRWVLARVVWLPGVSGPATSTARWGGELGHGDDDRCGVGGGCHHGSGRD